MYTVIQLNQRPKQRAAKLALRCSCLGDADQIDGDDLHCGQSSIFPQSIDYMTMLPSIK